MTSGAPHAVVVIGGGPAGLTAALELQARGVRDVVVVEADHIVGGLSRTVNHRGNRIDIGGHRFFSKSDWVMNWWTSMLPVASPGQGELGMAYRGATRSWCPPAASAATPLADSLLVRRRRSRILFGGRFFDYPLSASLATVRGLGWHKGVQFAASYLWRRVRGRRQEYSLEDFLINRFGEQLYRQFFKEYTEKVWGVPCCKISAAWGAQRIKSLSFGRGVRHALRRFAGRSVPTSLTENFLYPAKGPGQLWEAAARLFMAGGGRLLTGHRVRQISIDRGMARAVLAELGDGTTVKLECSHLVSTMPIQELVEGSRDAWSADALQIAGALQYRNFITVGLLYADDQMSAALQDQWIYVQEPGVSVARIQVYNNWSPAMVESVGHTWLGLEYFCAEGDSIWTMEDEELIGLAQREIERIGLVRGSRSVDGTIIRVPKAYPAYFGDGWKRFAQLRTELDSVANLFLIGRNGMHRYNNQDHSMLTAREAATQIAAGKVDKSRIWAIHVGDEYDEEA